MGVCAWKIRTSRIAKGVVTVAMMAVATTVMMTVDVK